jgi:hypothetical protein
MNDVLIVVLLIGALVILDVTAILFGYDSRDGFRSSHPGD